jgi:hypothetical protein
MLPTKFWIIWPSSYRREEFLKSANQKQVTCGGKKILFYVEREITLI